MKSVICRTSEVESSQRWDFAYHDPVYTKLMKSLDRYYPVIRFGDIITLLTDMGAFSLYKTEYFVEEGVPFLRVQNIQEYGIDIAKDTKYISFEYHNQLKKSQLQPNDLLLTTKAVIGIAAVVEETLGDCNISQNLVRIRLKDGISPHYLAAFLNSKLGRLQTQTAATGSNQKYLNFERIQDLKITLPPQYIQDRIAQIMQNAYDKRQNNLFEAERLYQTIDNYVFNRLGIIFDNVEEKKRFLKPIAEMYKSRFDVDFNMGFHKFDLYINQVLPVKAVAKFPKRIRKLSNEAEAIFQYIDISSIDIQLGEIEKTIEITEVSAPSRARQVVHTGDIIVSTVRPTRGAIALIQNEMEGFICSTGFTIIHPTKKVTSAYLHLALRLSTTLEQFRRRSAGSSYPAILESDIQETLIPIPDKEVQNEIATEVTQRCNKAKSLDIQAENLVNEAKSYVERMILGEEEVA